MHLSIISNFSNFKQQVLIWQNVINGPTIIRIRRRLSEFITHSPLGLMIWQIDALLARVDFKIHTEIVQLFTIIKGARRTPLNKIGI